MKRSLAFLSLFSMSFFALACDDEGSSGGAPTGSVCSRSADCQSGICAQVNNVLVCVSPCIDGACNTGFVCDTGSVDGRPLCVPGNTLSSTNGNMQNDGTTTVSSTGDGATGAASNGTPNPTGPVDVAGTSDAAACNALYNCAVNCQSNPNVEACTVQCQSTAGAEAVRLFNDFNGCVRNNCVTTAGNVDQGCILTDCGDEAAACGFGGTGATPSNVEYCGDVTGCIVRCGDDQFCAQGCLSLLDEDSQALFNAQQTCVSNNCGALANNPDPTALTVCLVDNCRAEYQACAYDGLTFGAGTCSETYDCYFMCGFVDTECQRDCRGLSNQTSNELFFDFFFCTQSVTCTQPGLSCWEDQCATEKAACDNDAGGAPISTDAAQSSAGGAEAADAAAGGTATETPEPNTAGAETSAANSAGASAETGDVETNNEQAGAAGADAQQEADDEGTGEATANDEATPNETSSGDAANTGDGQDDGANEMTSPGGADAGAATDGTGN